jgi:L-threonylcarbamoyladenylate synthase
MTHYMVETATGKDIARAAALLERGLIVAIPTETVYGLAANALNADAVLQIFEIKKRPKFDPLIVHGVSREQLAEHVQHFPEWASALGNRFWPGPLTLVLPKRDTIPDLVTSGLDHVAVRVPNHELTLDLLAQLDFPLAAPSANPFGYISPTSAEHVNAQLGGKIPYILDGGECAIGVESTIVAEQDGKIVVLRVGGIAVEEIEEIVGKVELVINASDRVQSPGSMESHYAPRTQLKLSEIDLNNIDPATTGIISFQTRYGGIPLEQQVVLSPEGDLREAAKNLFSAMRYLDGKRLKLILAEPVPEIGLGRAINDRLKRASVRK